MNNKEVELVLECMAVDMTGALCDTKEPMLDVLKQRIEAINIAQKALQENGELSGEPLTLEQLREMNGKAVRVSPKNEYSELGGVCIVSVGESDEYSGAYIPGVDHWYWSFDSYNDQWIAYAYLPARIDREAWTAEWKEYDGADAGFHYCSKCKQQAFNYEDGSEVVEVLSDFCPSCARAMTPEALVKLEKRIRGE